MGRDCRTDVTESTIGLLSISTAIPRARRDHNLAVKVGQSLSTCLEAKEIYLGKMQLKKSFFELVERNLNSALTANNLTGIILETVLLRGKDPRLQRNG